LGITPSSNQLSLAAGTYYVQAEAVTNFSGLANRGATEVAASKLRLRNITDSATLVTGLGSRFAHADDGGGSNQSADFSLLASLSSRFVLVGTKTVELQNWVSNALSSPVIKGGKALSSGEVEVYTDLKIWKIG
jgi:hypothetical protein